MKIELGHTSFITFVMLRMVLSLWSISKDSIVIIKIYHTQVYPSRILHWHESDTRFNTTTIFQCIEILMSDIYHLLMYRNPHQVKKVVLC